MDYLAGKAKLKEDGLLFQQVVEILFLGYLKNDEKVMHIVGNYRDARNDKKRRQKSLDDLELNQLRQLLESESPVSLLEKLNNEVNLELKELKDKT